jgi:hypothetical protein
MACGPGLASQLFEGLAELVVSEILELGADSGMALSQHHQGFVPAIGLVFPIVWEMGPVPGIVDYDHIAGLRGRDECIQSVLDSSLRGLLVIDALYLIKAPLFQQDPHQCEVILGAQEIKPGGLSRIVSHTN